MTSYYSKEYMDEINKDLEMKKEFTLTIEDLEEGKQYLRLEYGCNVYTMSKRGVVFSETRNNTIIKKGDRFKLIEKEAEFKEVRCYRDSGDEIRFFSEEKEDFVGTEQDYKIENGKLSVRDII